MFLLKSQIKLCDYLLKHADYATDQAAINEVIADRDRAINKLKERTNKQ